MEVKTKSRLSWLWPVVILGLPALMTLFTGRFSDPDDDWAIAALVAGRYDAQACPYVNLVLFQALALPARVFGVNAYGLFQVVATLAAFAAMGTAFFRRMERPVAAVLFGLLVFGFWQNSMVNYNYTYNSALCAWAGILLMDLFGRRLAGRWAAVCGVLLWWLGFLWRKESALLSLPFAALYLAYCLWKNRPDWKSIAKRVLPWAGLALGLAGVCFGLERWMWAAPEWAEYAAFNKARTVLVDYRTAPWSEAREDLEPLGISENDYWCATNWIFADPEFFDLERMQAMAQQASTPSLSEMAAMFASYVLRLPFVLRSALIFLLFCGACLILSGPLEWLTALCAGLGGLACSAFFMWAGRVGDGMLLTRAADVIWLSAICCTAMLLIGRPLCKKRWFRAAGYAAAALFVLYNGVRILPWVEQPDWMTGAPEIQDEAVARILEQKQGYYLWDVNQAASHLNGAYGNARLPSEDFDRFNGTLGGWTEGAPFLAKHREALGISNPMRALVERQDVYLVDQYHPERILTYVQEHYEPRAALSVAQQLEEELWALKITPPLTAQQDQQLNWKLQWDGQWNGRITQEDAAGWYQIGGRAQGLPEDAELWLRLTDSAGAERCFLLMRQGEEFSGVVYLDELSPEGGFTARLLWQQEGGEMNQSSDSISLWPV